MTVEISYAEALNKIVDDDNMYVVGIISTADVMRNEVYVRSRLVRLMLQIEDFLRKHGIHRKAVMIPEDSVHFYSTFFNASGFDTYLMTRFFSNDNLTDYKFVSVDEKADAEIYNQCSLIIHISNPDEDDERQEEFEDMIENENVVYIEVTNLPEETELEKIQNPSQLLNNTFKMNIKRRKADPYQFMPEYDEIMYTRVPLKHFEEMMENMPTVGESDRFTATSSSEEDNNVPPESVRKEAQKGLDLRDEFNRGGTAVGIARARDLSNGENVSNETIQRMVSFFSRHQKNRVPPSKEKESDGGPTNGWIAWLLWGGDAGKTWAEKRWAAIKKERGEK